LGGNCLDQGHEGHSMGVVLMDWLQGKFEEQHLAESGQVEYT